MKSTGKFNEGIMEFLLNSIGLKDISPAFDSQHLIATAKQIRPGRIENVETKLKNFRGWNRVESKFIVDRVYGLDYIVEVKPSTERIAFDFTTNADKISEKIEKAKTFAPLWKSLGISKVIILLSVYPQGEDQGLAFYDKDRAQDDLLSIIFNAVESEEEVCSSTIQIQHEVATAGN